MRIKPLLIASAALAIALPALAQQAAQPAPQPRPSTPPLTQAPSNPTTPTTQPGYLAAPSDESAVEEIANLQLAPPPPPVEYPSYARRDPWTVGALPPTQVGLDADPWGGASGVFLSTLLRRMGTPIASRSAHIALRGALLAKARAPRAGNPVDWGAEPSRPPLRLGEG